MYRVRFKRSSQSDWEDYKVDYNSWTVCQAEQVWLQANGYWYDLSGILFPSGSVNSTLWEPLGNTGTPTGLLLSLTKNS